MNKVDIVKTIFNFDDREASSVHLTEGFQATSEAEGPPLDKARWVGMGQLFKAAFPDIEAVIEDIREEGEGVVMAVHSSGNFSNDLDLSAAGMGVIPASGAMVDFPGATYQVSFDGDLVSRVHNTKTGPDAGFAGVLKALGVDVG